MLVTPDFFTSDEWRNQPRHRCFGSYNKIVAISGGFDPMHGGHLRYILEASKLYPSGTTLVAIVNGDGFLDRKKGYHLLNQQERAEIVDAIRGVDYTMIWDDGSQYVAEALKLIHPHVFAKGGDRRNDKTMPREELNVVKYLGIELVYGVGGFDKLNSSSELIKNLPKLQQDLSSKEIGV